jgi:hypothetical protein
MRYQAALRPDCAETYGNRGFEATPKITVIRTNTETTDLAGPMATKSPAKSPADVHERFTETAMAVTFESLLTRVKGMEIDPTPHPVVYFISAADKPRHPVKIGRSTMSAVYGRLSSLQTGSPLPLDFLAIWYPDRDMEREVHRAFEPLRLHGEWFRRGKALIEFMEVVRQERPDWRERPHRILLREKRTQA